MNNGVPQVLLLEDDIKLAEKIKAYLEKHFGGPIEIWLAHSVEQAETFLREQLALFDTVITDIMMPDGTPGGLAVAAQVARRLPVIVISAFPPKDYAEQASKFGPTIFIPKSASDEFGKKLIQELRRAVAWKTHEETLSSEEREIKHHCLSRQQGAILLVRFRLNAVSADGVLNPYLTSWDFAALAIGCREWQAAVEAHDGRPYAFHDQLFAAAFLDGEQEQSAVTSAVEAYFDVRRAIEDDGASVFYRCPFTATVIPSQIVSGMFGVRTPGVATIVGRSGDLAWQMAIRGEVGELATVRNWLTDERRSWFDGLPGETRVDQIWPTGLDGSIETTYLQGEVN